MNIKTCLSITAFAALFAIHPANAAPPSESPSLGGLKFGESPSAAAAAASTLGIKLTKTTNYNQTGTIAPSIAFEEYGDAYDNSLNIQYSRITQKIVAISRQIKFPKPIPLPEMQKSVAARFGRETSGPKYNYNFERNSMHQFAWDREGTVVQTVRCDVHLLPIRTSESNCGTAASSSLISQDGYVTGQSIVAVDWATLHDEIVKANASASALRKKQMEEAAKNSIPKL